MKMKGKILKALASLMLVVSFFLVGCSMDVPQGKQDSQPTNDANTLLVLTSSELTQTAKPGQVDNSMQPFVDEFNKNSSIKVKLVPKGSVDIMQDLSANSDKYDAVWVSNSIWLSMGDKAHKVKDAKSVMTSPVVMGIRKSLAEQLGFVGKQVKMQQILDAVQNKKLKFVMTSASQSNSGATFYLGSMQTFLGQPQSISMNDLNNPELKQKMTTLLSGVNRSSGSSGWLEDLFLKSNYDAMVNYESVIIDANQKLIAQGKEPLYCVYPVDGMTIADYPIGYINNGNTAKEETFKKFQNFLMSDSVQKRILNSGRRTGFGGQVEGANPAVFNADWGIDVKKTITPINYPAPDVIYEALNKYQTDFKKPSITLFALDFSGSMGGNGGEEQLKQAMDMVLKEDEAKKYLLQSSSEDIIAIEPFSSQSLDFWQAKGPKEMEQLDEKVNALSPDGGTDIYSPIIDLMDKFKNTDFNKYNVSVVLMTDGQSNTGKTYDDLQAYFKGLGEDIPVFTIGFGGDVDNNQLQQIADLTSGKKFDTTTDLVSAFKQIRGYN